MNRATLLLLLGLGCMTVAGAQPGAAPVGADEPGKPDSAKAQARLEGLRARLDKADKEEREKIRLELLRLQYEAPGTGAALGAARLVMRLPSPLDELDAANIPKEERFDWMPKEVVAVLGNQRGRLWGYIAGLAASRDGKYLITTDQGGLRLFDAVTLNERAFVRLAQREFIFRTLLSRDSRTLATFHVRWKGPDEATEEFWQVWDVTATGLKRRLTQPQPAEKGGLVPAGHVRPAFLADNKTILLPGEDGLELWDVSSNPPKRQRTLGEKDLVPVGEPVVTAVSEDGTTLVMVTLNAFTKGRQVPEKEGGEPWPKAHLNAWTIPEGMPFKRVELAPKGFVKSLALSPDGKSLALVVMEKTRPAVELWDRSATPPRLQGRIPMPEGVSKEFVLVHKGSRLIILAPEPGKPGLAQLLQWELGPPGAKALPTFLVSHLPRSMSPEFPWAVTTDLQRLILEGKDRRLCRWDLATGKPEGRAPEVGHLDRVYCVRFLPDGRRLASGSGDHTIRFWEPAKGKFVEQATLQHGGAVFDLAFAPRTHLMVSSGFTPTRVRLWDLTAQPPRERDNLSPLPNAHAWGSTFSPAGTTLYIGTGLEVQEDGSKKEETSEDAIHVWDVSGATAKKKAVLQEEKGAVIGLTVSPDGKWLASAGGRFVYNRGVPEKPATSVHLRLWDITATEPKEITRLPPHTKVVYSVAFAPNGKLLASASRDYTVRLWDVSGKEPSELGVLKRHEESVFSVAFAPDGKTLASCGADGRIILWDVAGKAVQREWILPGLVNRVAFAPDGRHLASANENGTVYIFRLAPPPK